MLRDKVGNAYVQVVALLTSLSGLLLIARAVGAAVWHVALPVLAVLTLFSVYAFVRLGQRAFYFFDPTVLATRVERDFRTWFRRAQAGGYRAADQSFQPLPRPRACRRRLVRGAGADRDAARDGRPRSARLSTSIVRTLRAYVLRKHEIPAQSLWFGQRPRHRFRIERRRSGHYAMVDRRGLLRGVLASSPSEWLEKKLGAASTASAGSEMEEKYKAFTG